MKDIEEIIGLVTSGNVDEQLMKIYVDPTVLDYQKARYVQALQKFESVYGKKDVEIYSAPGRSEVGGNHTDHQHGEVLATSINLDAIAVVAKTSNGIVKVLSDDRPMVEIPLSDLAYREEEKESSVALMKGVLAKLQEEGYSIGGFDAYATSDVLVGAGLSSSAAFETLIGTIISGLYNDMAISPVEIAKIGQYAENVYFGKPCGLMDQMACSVGGLVHIDFADTKAPIIEKVDFDMEAQGYSLCITDTKGSHSDLTADYAAIPQEMCSVAKYLGKDVLHEVDEAAFWQKIAELREKLGDRAVLRGIHFFEENKRVGDEVAALKAANVQEFMKVVRKSGDSSYKYLQNVYTNHDIAHQNVSVALAVSEIVLEQDEASRVHGGGFAGTIQAFVKNANVGRYKERLEAIFGDNTCKVLRVRSLGGARVI